MGNIALNKPASAGTAIKPFSADRAVDGSLDAAQRWLGSYADPNAAWLSVDLGQPYWINRWVLKNMAAINGWSPPGWPAPNYCMLNYKFQVSNNNSTWMDIDAVTNNTAAVTDRTFIAAQFRYVRVSITGSLRINPQLVSIQELEVYEASNTVPHLSNLVISDGALTPSFNKDTGIYTALATDASITVTPTAQQGSTITVNNQLVDSGQSSAPIALAMGNNTIKITVASSSGSRLYLLTVTRTASPYLNNIVITYSARGSSFGTVTVITSSKTQNIYTVDVPAPSTSITITPNAQDPTAQIKVNNQNVPSGGTSSSINLSSATTQVVINVTSADNLNRMGYIINITKSS